MARSAIRQFPIQKVSINQKGKKWRRQHLDWADTQSRLFNETIRKRVRDKKINVDFYNGIIHQEDMKLILNPTNLKDFYIPDGIQHFPVAVPRVNVLVGEESARKFSWRVTINSPTAISKIEDNKKKLISDKVQELITQNYTEEEIEKELQRFSDYINFEWQDIREKRGNLLLKHFSKECEIKDKFDSGFKDVLLHGEEGYLSDIINGNPYFEKLNPLKTFIIRHGYSKRYEDADIIVVDDYWSPGRVVDTYYDSLTSKDIDYIQGDGYVPSNTGGRDLDGDLFKEDINDRDGILLARNFDGYAIDDYLDTVDLSYEGFRHRTNYFDVHGNIRVLRIFWASYKKIYKIEWYDDDGNKQIKYRNEDYVLNEELGETKKSTWIKQWWQGTKLGEKVYVDIRPRPIQYNKIGNPGYNTPGVVGEIYSTNEQKVVSMIDRMKVFNYLYDACWHRIMESLSKYFGPILEIDKAKFPDKWDLTKSLYFAKKAGILLIDSFKEGRKGAATGKLAGGVGNTSGKIYNADIAGYIQQMINIMEYCKAEMDEVVGVSKQRLGAIEARETVGGIDTSIRQSNYVTQKLYKDHDKVKRRALMLFLETCKIAMRGNKLKLQYIADDYTNQLMEIDGDEIAEEDYGLDITSDSYNAQLEQNLNSLAHAALQNQTLSFGTITKIFTSPSITEVQRLIEKDENERMLRESENQDKQLQVQQEIEAKKDSIEQANLSIKEFDITERSRIEELKILWDEYGKSIDRDNDGIINEGENNVNTNLDLKKHKDELMIKIKELDNDMKKHRDELMIKKEELKIKKKQINKQVAKIK